MVIATNKKIAGAYAEAIFDTLLKGTSIENTKNILETLQMLMKPLEESGKEESTLYFKLIEMYSFTLYKLSMNEPVDLDDDVFTDHLNWLVEHQND